MTTLLRWWRTYGKAHVALVGSVLTWAATTYPDTPLGRYAGIVIAALTAAGVVLAPHKSKNAPLNAGTVTVQVEADVEHFLEQIAGSLHSAGDAVTASKPKAKPAKKA